MVTSGTKPSLLWSWGSAQGIFGAGTLGKGLAFRKIPYSRGGSPVALPWSAGGSAWIAGFKVDGVSMVWKSDGDLASKTEPTSLSKNLRLAVLEFDSNEKDPLRFAASMQLSRLPEKDSGSGWQAGSGNRASQTLLGLSLSSEYRADGAGTEFWASGICGFLTRPSFAASIQVDSGYFALGGSGWGSTEARLSCFAYGSGRGFLDLEGERPTWDRVLDLNIDFRGERWSLGLALLSYSKKSGTEDEADLRLPKPGIPGIELLLWGWRTDLISPSLSARLGNLKAAAKAKADGQGLASLSASLRYDLLRSEAKGGWSLGCGLKAERLGASEADSDEDEGPDADAEQETGSGSLYLKQVGASVLFGWPDSGRLPYHGSFSLGFLVKRGERNWEPVIDFDLGAGARIGGRWTVDLKASAPSSGYSLIALPDALPNLSLGFSLGGQGR
ncbi:MAG: hypothetical protein NT061_00205 [Spirochaetes bacterium]|nr:hypothetical protein [Spirochaetota bacterium]